MVLNCVFFWDSIQLHYSLKYFLDSYPVEGVPREKLFSQTFVSHHCDLHSDRSRLS